MVLLCIPSPAENSSRKFLLRALHSSRSTAGRAAGTSLHQGTASQGEKVGKKSSSPTFAGISAWKDVLSAYFKHFKVTVTFFHRSREENNRQVEEGKEEGNESSHSKSSPSSQLCPSEQPGEVRRGQSLSCTKGPGSGSL